MHLRDKFKVEEARLHRAEADPVYNEEEYAKMVNSALLENKSMRQKSKHSHKQIAGEGSAPDGPSGKKLSVYKIVDYD